MEVASLFTSAKIAYEIAKGISSLKSEVERNEAVSKILEILISVQKDAFLMQEKHSLLLREKDDMTKKLMEFEKWDETEYQYELKEIYPGILLYGYKEREHAKSPMHWLCPNCWHDKKKSILQRSFHDSDSGRYTCPKCKNIFEWNNPDFGCGTTIRG